MKPQRWLQQEVPHWVADHLVTEEQAARILARYAGREGSVARTVFSVLGAVVFGLGVILFFAWNWSSMGHASKLGVIFTALLTAQAAGAVYRWRGQLPLGEGLSALGTLLFGSGIFLISQIYHIDEHYPNGFLLWGTGALLMAWALPSAVQGVLACLLYAVWVSCEMFDFQRHLDLAAPLLAMALLPLAWQLRSRLLFQAALYTSGYCLLVALAHQHDRYLLAELFLLALALVTAGPLLRTTGFPAVADLPRRAGYLGYLSLLVILAFRESDILLNELQDEAGGFSGWYAGLLALAALGTAGALRTAASTHPTVQASFALLLCSTVLVLLGTHQWGVSGYTLWVWANVASLAHAVLWIIDGARNQQGRKVALACLLFSAIAIPRFLDLFDSMLMRSLLFLLLGALLFLVGNFYQRQKAGAR